jgi:hypothetical protein
MKSKTYWSAHVNATSNALDTQGGVFTWDDPEKIAKSLRESAENSIRRKAPPFMSAMSMLNFYINRAGKNLSASRLKILNQAKRELRKLYHRD